MPTEKKQPTEEERYQSMLRFSGAWLRATSYLAKVSEQANVLAGRLPGVSYTDSARAAFNSAEVDLPELLTEVNRAVEVMNRALGGWIGGGEKTGPDWAELASANAALLDAAEQALAHGKEYSSTLKIPEADVEDLAQAIARVRRLRHGR